MPQITIPVGATLNELAQQYKTTQEDLMKINPQIKDPNLIFAGAQLNLPDVKPIQPVIQPSVQPTIPPQIQTTPVKITPSIETTSDVLTKEPKTYGDIQALMEENSKLREKYLAELQKPQEQIDLETQIADVRRKAKEYELTAEEQLATEKGIGGIPQPIFERRGGYFTEKANIQLRRLSAQEANLLTRLGLSQEAQKAKQEVLKTGLSFIQKDIGTQNKIEERLREKRKEILDEAVKLSTVQKNTLNQLTNGYSHFNLSEMTPEIKNQIATQAIQTGIPVDLALNTIQQAHDENIVKKMKSFELSSGQTRYEYNPTTGKYEIVANQPVIPKQENQPIANLFTKAQIAKMEGGGLLVEDATNIYKAIQQGHTLESIREALKQDGKDPILLDIFDRVNDIQKILRQKSVKKEVFK